MVRVLAADGTLAPTAAAEPYLDIIDALSEAELEGFYRDMFVIRAFDQQATNLQRQGQLGALAAEPRPGGGSGRLCARRAPAGPHLPVLPRARRRSHPRCRSARHHPRHARPHARRVGPDRPAQRQHPSLHARARIADAARDRRGHGPRVRRALRHGRPRARRGRDRLLRRRRVQPGRRARGDGLRRELPHAADLLPAEQPVGHLGAGRDAVALAAAQARRGLRDAEHPGRRQRRARELCRHPRGARRGAGRCGPARDRGADLSTGCAHHERRPDEVPHVGRGAVLDPPRSDRPHARVTSSRAAHRTPSSRMSRPRRRTSPKTSGCGRPSSGHSPTSRCSSTCTPSRIPSSTSSAQWLAEYEASFEEGAS